MPLKRLGAPPYLLPDEVENDDLVEIVEKPYVVPADKTKWGRERGKTTVKLMRTGDIRRWTLNATTWDRLIDVFGEDADQWLNKKVRIKKEERTISGVAKTVLFGVPYKEPQQNLDIQPHSVDEELLAKVRGLPPEAKKGLLEALKEKPAEA